MKMIESKFLNTKTGTTAPAHIYFGAKSKSLNDELFTGSVEQTDSADGLYVDGLHEKADDDTKEDFFYGRLVWLVKSGYAFELMSFDLTDENLKKAEQIASKVVAK